MERAASTDQTQSQSTEKDQSLLQRIRNCWEFASLMQYIFFFGKIMKIDEDLTIEVRDSAQDVVL